MDDEPDFDDEPPAADNAFGAVDALNPAQRQVVDLLGSKGRPLPQFDAELRHHLRAALESGLAPLLDAVPKNETLYLSKYPLAQVHACEARFLAGNAEPFAWSVPTARGSISHKAIELSIHWDGQPPPLDLVDEATARLEAGSGSLADWLQTITEVERAELRAQANERVAKFLECFPPLKAAWRPVTESTVKVEMFDQRIVLQGRVDLTLGHAKGTTANKVLIDLKSGSFSPTHVEDLRFYALVEAMRIGTPPRKLATYYLDSGHPHPEDVSEDLLFAAIHRTVDGATRLVELLHHEHPPTKRTGPACSWCPLSSDCVEGAAWLAHRDDDTGGGWSAAD